MDNQPPLLVRFDDESSQIARNLAKRLKTTPAQVFVKALVLLKRVQGKKIILQEDNNPITMTYDLYAK